MRPGRTFVNLNERAITIFTDGSMLPGPRRGGLAFRVVVHDALGEEITYDEQLPGYRDATNNQMELLAVVKAIQHVSGRYSPVKPRDYSKIAVYTDSSYVANNYKSAIYSWREAGWCLCRNSRSYRTKRPVARTVKLSASRKTPEAD